MLAQTPVGTPEKDETVYRAVNQESEGSLKHLRGKAEVRTATMLITGDAIDYDEDTNLVKARGHVTLEHFVTKDKVNCDRADYNIKTRNGKFYNVSGTSPAKVATTPWILTTVNPFYFHAEYADRIDDRYILHHGYITDCKLPKPWWTFHAPVFDIIPNERAIGRQTVFKLKGAPIFYLPYFYRPLGKNPRKSGFLTPEVGNSSQFGYMVGEGYYWAINPSYDMTGRVQYMTDRGPAFLYDFRGKPNAVTDFDLSLHDVDDSGKKPAAGAIPTGPNPFVGSQGGLDLQLRASTEIWGFQGRLDYNYLSSLLFREIFSYSFNNAISNEVDSIGFLQRRFDQDQLTLSIVAQREQTFEALTQPHSYRFTENGQSITIPGQPANQVVLQKLPSVEATTRDRQILGGPLPLWFSVEGSTSLLTRSDPSGAETVSGPPASTLSSGPYGRADVEPHVETNYQFKGFSLTPGITFGATDYTTSYAVNSTTYSGTTPVVSESLSGDNLFRKDADIVVDLRTPALERIYVPAKWLHLGEKLKHVIEADAKYEYVTGTNQFDRILHFDQTDILSNTNQLTLRLTNRIYRKDKAGNVSEVFTWDLVQARYFDPTFGGAVLGQGTRNVVLASADIMPYAFLDGPRNYSPIVSIMTLNPYAFLSLEWRADYDPLGRTVLGVKYGQKLVDQTYGVTFRHKNYFGSISQTAITTDPLLVPQANQIGYGGGYGNSLRKGWNVAGSVTHDVLRGQDLFENFQVAYNTDCCGFSLRYQHINFGARHNENQYLFSFSVANIGTFGSLQHQQRVF